MARRSPHLELWLAILVIAVTVAVGPLTAIDNRWIAANLNIDADSPAITGLTPAQQRRLHAIIADRALNPTRKLQEAATLIDNATSQSLDGALSRSVAGHAAD